MRVVIASSLASFLPFVLLVGHFRALFFFHDDWLMLDGADRLGLRRWLIEPFVGEGVFPIFKLLWLGALHLTGGSYFGLILILWITHAVICLLFGWLLVRSKLTATAIAFALLTFGLSWTNIETLGWSMQWCPQLAIVFFLGAWHFLLEQSKPRRSIVACILCLLASALSSTRGIVSGLVLSSFVIARNRGKERIRLCVVCIAPVVFTSAMMWLLVPHHSVKFVPALAYAWDYLVLNPLYRPLPFHHQGFDAGVLLVCGLSKAVVYVLAFRWATPTARPLVWTLLIFDLITAGSVGYARWQTGLDTVAGSRYQYIPLLCFGPVAGISIARIRPSAVRIAIVLACAFGLAQPWKRHIEQWSTQRGKELRVAIAHNAREASFDPSLITSGRARQLIRLYGLH